MSLLVLGLSHRSAPVSVLERTVLTGDDTRAKLLQDALAAEPVTEAVLLSTCNRIELYADVDKFHAGVAELSALLSVHSGVPLDELTPYLYVHYEDRAVHHLFSVACGLDSMVVGESQILGQIKDALGAGQELHSAGRALNELFQQALRVGKRAHSETGIDKAGQSLVTFGLQQLAGVVGDLRGKRALIVGAGSMSSLAATTLSRQGVTELVVANRTHERGERLAASLGGRAVRFSEVTAELAEADIAVSCTGATGLVLTRETVAEVLKERAGRHGGEPERPLALLDLAMPRDIDAEVRDLPGVHLVDIELLAEAESTDAGAGDVDQARRIVAAEVKAFRAAQRAERIVPTVVALRTMAADVVAGELARLRARLPGMDDKTQAEVTQTVRRVVDKLLHAPTVRVKQLAGEPGGDGYAEALRKLFDLDPEAVTAISRADTGDPDRRRA